MTYSVSSWFVDQTQRKDANPVRQFFIGTSDYGSLVTKWPNIRRRWDAPRPVSATIELANEGQDLNFIRLNKTLLTTACSMKFGFEHVNLLVYNEEMNNTSVWGIPASTTVTPNTAVDPNGNTTIDTVADISATLYGQISQYVINVFDKSKYYCAQLLIKKDAVPVSTRFCGLRLFFSGGTPTEANTIYFQTDTGIYVTSRVSENVESGVEDYDDNFWLVWISARVIEQTNTAVYLYLYPAFGTIWAAGDPATTGSVQAGWAMLSEGRGPKKYEKGAISGRLTSKFETITMFAGTIQKLKYGKGTASLTVTDKMIQLSERLIGSRDTPVDYTSSNYLLSDLAWYIVTSHGGFNATKSTANPDIDYTEFSAWAGIMSGDTVLAKGYFDGQKVTELLRKISRMSHTGIFIEEDKLVFSRFSVSAAPKVSITGSSLISGTITVDHDDVINKQYVSAGYNVSSDRFSITVVSVDTSSVNSYGAHEHLEEDKSIWYVNSNSALNLAQRKTYTVGEPADRITIDVPLVALTEQIGDTLTYTNDLQGISDNYRIMEHSIDFDKTTLNLTIDQTQVVNAFILDVTSLDGSEVLT